MNRFLLTAILPLVGCTCALAQMFSFSQTHRLENLGTNVALFGTTLISSRSYRDRRDDEPVVHGIDVMTGATRFTFQPESPSPSWHLSFDADDDRAIVLLGDIRDKDVYVIDLFDGEIVTMLEPPEENWNVGFGAAVNSKVAAYTLIPEIDREHGVAIHDLTGKQSPLVLTNPRPGTALFAKSIHDLTGKQSPLVLTNPRPGTALFAKSIALGDGVIAVSSSEFTSQSGLVDLFDVQTGRLLRTLRPFNLAPSEKPGLRSGFGSGLVIENDRLLVGDWPAFFASDGQGIVDVFQVSTGRHLYEWTAEDAGAIETPFFGSPVDASGNLAIIGAHHHGADNRGGAFLFDLTTGELLSELTPAPLTPDAEFGHSVAISGTIAAVNAWGENATPTYVFQVPEGHGSILLMAMVVLATVAERRRHRSAA